MTLEIKVSRLDESIPLPTYATNGDAGADLISSIDVDIPAGNRALVPTGLSLAIPEGYVGLVCSRSGLAWKHGVTVLNAPGVIDSGYRGEVKVILLNPHASQSFSIKKGDRIAQLLIQKVEQADFIEVENLDSTDRGQGGFGSTGV
jgi:dUTP pyrophosphatase